jgi:hypothetical protein
MQIPRRTFLESSLAASVGSTLHRVFPAAASLAPPASLTKVSVGEPIVLADSRGDTWVGAWAADGNLYTPSNDTSGFRNACRNNLAFNRLQGDDPLHLTGDTINLLNEYGREGQRGPDGATWKSSGCLFIDDALYLVIARHTYGEESADLNHRQTAENASIIRSTDLGKTWTRDEQQNYATPTFPGRRFATPYFIQYGYGHHEISVDNADKYVYAISNNGFWDCGDDIVLGRVERNKLAQLNGHDWEFYTGGDGMQPSAWKPKMQNAKQLLVAPGRLGMSGPVYLHDRQRYLMIGWYYPEGGGKAPGAGHHTIWDFYESPRPWGPWTRIGSYDSEPKGLYTPEICPKFQTASQVYAIAAGYWFSEPDYKLTLVPLQLT